MICIECLQPVAALYSVYANGHIQLTACPSCNNVADKYVEIDDVIMFIDLLLLKPGAFRHIVYNSLEERISIIPAWKPVKGSRKEKYRLYSYNVKNWYLKYNNLIRYWILVTAFEIYLRWSSEDSKARLYLRKLSPDKLSSTHLITSKILTSNFLHQYLYFAIYCLCDILFFHYVTIWIITKLYNWKADNDHSFLIISYTALISYGAKILPTLMLIWPYDTISSMGLIKWVANFYLIESMKIVTRFSYISIFNIFIVVSIFRVLFSKLMMACLFADSIGDLWLTIRSEYLLMIQKYIIARDFF